MAALRILTVIGTLDRGGAELQLSQILPRLHQRGHSVGVHCLRSRGELADALEASGVAVTQSAAVARARGGLPGRIQRFFKQTRPFRQVLRTMTPDVVHCVLPHAFVFAAPLTPPTIPIVYSRLSLDFYQTPSLSRRERRLHPRVAAYIDNSAATFDQLREEGADPERFHLVPNGLDPARTADPARRNAVRRMLGLDESTLVFLTVANLHAYKGHVDLIDALALASARLPSWHLLLAGRDAGAQADLERRLARTSIGGRVSFLGLCTDVAGLYSACDIAVHPSRTEGLPNAVLEALGSGLPVIAAAVGALPTLIDDGRNGILVPSEAPEALAEAIVRLASSPDLRRQMGQAGQSLVRTGYSVERCADGYESAYEAAVRFACGGARRRSAAIGR